MKSRVIFLRILLYAKLTKPIECCCKRSLLRTSPKRECFTNDDPYERSPSGGEGSNEHASANNHYGSRARMLRRWSDNTDNGENEQPGCLPKASTDQWYSAPKALNQIQTRESACDIDSAENKLNEDRVIDTSCLENNRAILEEMLVLITTSLRINFPRIKAKSLQLT